MSKTIEWIVDKDHPEIEYIHASGKRVGWISPRPHYCDRGRWQVDIQYFERYGNIDIPQIDGADRFPRYYMSQSVAKSETEAFIRWRLWKERIGQ